MHEKPYLHTNQTDRLCKTFMRHEQHNIYPKNSAMPCELAEIPAEFAVPANGLKF